MDMMFQAVIRKLIFMLLLFVSYVVFDSTILRGFDTREVLKDDPKALAILLAGFCIALAYA